MANCTCHICCVSRYILVIFDKHILCLLVMAGSVNLIRDLSKYSTARLHIATRATGHRDRSYLMEDQIKFFDSENRRMLGLIDERMGCMDIYGQRFLHVMH